MAESFPGATTAEQSDTVHELTESYMSDLSKGRLNEFDVGEDLASRIAGEEIDENTAEAVTQNLGIDEVLFED
jgi:hypothetical protein